MNTCETCAAFSALSEECRRASPRASLVKKPDGTFGAIGFYPATGKDSWCAEWLDHSSMKTTTEKNS